MVKFILRTGSTIVLAAAIASFATAQAGVTGSWTGRFVLEGKPGKNGGPKGTVALTVNKDGTYLYKTSNDKPSVHGKWQLAGNQLRLFWDRPKINPKLFMQLTIDKGGKKLIGPQGRIGHEVFTRS